MFSTDLSTILASIAVLFSSIAWLYAYRCWDFCRDTEEFIKLQNKRSLSLSKMAEVEATLTELQDSYDALLTSHKKLRSRIGMRANRATGGTSEPQIPDAATDPAGYKRAMRLKLGQGSLK